MTELYSERLPAASAAAPELVLLHGWGSHSGVWRALLPRLRSQFNITLMDLPGFGASAGLTMSEDPDQVVDCLLPALPPRAVYLGWSLGGMLATRLAARYPERVLALMTVASNACFSVREHWPAAMPAETFSSFQTLVTADIGKGLKRFHALQCKGDGEARAVKRHLEYVAAQIPTDGSQLQAGLRCLERCDNSGLLSGLAMPAWHGFGAEDALVPVAAAELFRQRFPSHQVTIFADAGHLPFVSQPQAFIAAMSDFLCQHGVFAIAPGRQVDKRDVARSFSLAATSYDSVAALQRRVADQLLAAAPAGRARTLDLGCGTGYSLPALAARCGGDNLLALDIAPGMLTYARDRHVARGWVCGDAEDLPLADHSLDQVFSSLSLQWCENLAAAFSEIARVLRPGGRAYIATLGPGTLCELRHAWRQVDEYVHVNQFHSREVVQRAAEHSPITIVDWRECTELMYYQSLAELTRELKRLGAHNINGGRPGGLTGRRRLLALTAAYECYRGEDGRLPASYQVWYLSLQKPHS